MLKHIAGRLVSDGHAVTVLTSQPSYNPAAGIPRQPYHEFVDGVRIVRARLLPESKKNFVSRGINLLLFMTKVFFHIIRKKQYDIVMAATTPPVLVAMTARIASGIRKSSFVYHCQDIHPELTLYSGLLKKGWFFRLLHTIDRRTVRAATRVVVLSQDMKNTLNAREAHPLSNIRVINNFLPGSDDAKSGISMKQANKRFRIIFAGNLGYFQGLEVVVDAAKLLDNDTIEIIFLGDGASKSRLMERTGTLLGDRVQFLGHVSQQQAEAHIRQADVCLITLGQGIINTAYPSKTITYLSQGRPLLVVVEESSELATMVKAEDIGMVSAPGDARALADNILAMARRQNEIPLMGQRAKEKSLELFGYDNKMNQWSHLISDISQERSADYSS